MARRRSGRLAALVVVIVGVVFGGTAQMSLARLTSSTTLASNTFTTATSFDTTPPTVSSSVISKTGQYVSGYIHPGGTYYVYANVTDSGTGVATVTANVSNIATGSTAVVLVAGSYTVNGVTYNYRSASLTAKNPLAAGTATYSITAIDGAGNSGTTSGLTVVVDNTAPFGAGIQTADGGGTVGTIEPGDTVTYTFSEVIDPQSILGGWNGASTSVVVRFTNNARNDSFAIWDSTNTFQLGLGSVNTHGDYVTGAVTIGATGTPSTMVLNNATSTITITFGTISGSVKNDNKKHTAAWAPSSAALDRAGNAMSTTVVNGANVKGF
ncbi:MAG TPA: hypothetical protein VNF73_16015 [Candidatus Saccharimonadales bacterium]|nr:hypothetical protein [Candidatus Saccharimonadales bacterium]